MLSSRRLLSSLVIRLADKSCRQSCAGRLSLHWGSITMC